jgi:hypothetical protein
MTMRKLQIGSLLCLFGCCTFAIPTSYGVLVTYEVIGTVGYGGDFGQQVEVLDTGVDGGPNQFRIGSTYVGQPMRLVFTYDTEQFDTWIANNDDMTEFIGSYADSILVVGGDLLSRVSFGRIFHTVERPTSGLILSGGLIREGGLLFVAFESVNQFRPDGRILPPGGSLALTSPNDGMEAGIVSARSGDMIIREVVPEPSSAGLVGLATVTLLRRRRRPSHC